MKAGGYAKTQVLPKGLYGRPVDRAGRGAGEKGTDF